VLHLQSTSGTFVSWVFIALKFCGSFVYYIFQNAIQPTIHIHIPQNARHKIMPDKKERGCWWAFLAGRSEADWNPPKKQKPDASRKRHSYGRDYSPESDSAEGLQPTQETWHINDEGEVELALSNDPTESLPTPSGTPAPPEPPGEALGLLYDQSTSHEPPTLKQREPTPSLITCIDQVSDTLLMYLFPLISHNI
jgi:hypothetical protein